MPAERSCQGSCSAASVLLWLLLALVFLCMPMAVFPSSNFPTTAPLPHPFTTASLAPCLRSPSRMCGQAGRTASSWLEGPWQVPIDSLSCSVVVME